MESFRQILPARPSDGLETSLEGPGSQSAANETVRRRRKVLEKPALIACLECRRTRVKCNGNPPETCARCRMRGYTCAYPPHTKLQKDDILHELAQARAWGQGLEQRNRDLSAVLDVMTRYDSHQEIVSRLRSGEDVSTILAWLSTHSELEIHSLRARGLDESLENAINNILHISGMVPSVSGEERPRWTGVTSNAAFLDYLVGLYLHNTEAEFLLFRLETFMQSYMYGEPDTCSSTLLNAICSMACQFLVSKLMAPEDRANVKFIQAAFMREAQSSIKIANSQDITTIQAMTIMYMISMSNAQARVASIWLKVATENLRSLEAEIELTVDFDLARWAVYSLETLWSAYAFQNPCWPQSSNMDVTFDSTSNLQSPQAQEPSPGGHHRLLVVTPSIAIHAAAFRARLCQLSRSVFRTYCGLNGIIETSIITSIQNKLYVLLDTAPTCLKDVDLIHTDSCLQNLHLLYYGVAVSLWSPLVSFAQMQQNQGMLHDFQDLLLESSRKGFKHIEDRLGGAHEKDLLPQSLIYVINICDSIARWTSSTEERSHVLHCCMEVLSRNTSSSALCRNLMKLFLAEMVKFVEEELIIKIQASFDLSEVCSVEEALDATTRLTYMSPFAPMVNWISPDFASRWSTLTTRRSSASSGRPTMRIKDLCN